MKIFITHPVTREYLGPGLADPDPLDDGAWLIPAHAWYEAPPVAPAGQAVRRTEDGSAWELVADYRGTVYRTDSGEAQQHTTLGELPADLTSAPRPSAEHLWDGTAWVFNVALQAANHSALQANLCTQIDTAADAARRAVAGDPLRAVEYDRARIEAEQFAANDYQGDVPPMVAAWAINGRTPQQAAESILHEAAQYTAALVQLRTARLAAKEQIRALMAADQVEQAQQLADQTIAAIEAAVAGIGNNA